MFLGVAEFANRGRPVTSTREDVLNVSWHEESCPQNLDATSLLTAPDCEMDKFRQVAEPISMRCCGGFLVLLGAQAEVLNRTVVLDEVHGAFAADIPVHVWLAGYNDWEHHSPVMHFSVTKKEHGSSLYDDLKDHSPVMYFSVRTKSTQHFYNPLCDDWKDHSPEKHFSVEGQLEFPVWSFICSCQIAHHLTCLRPRKSGTTSRPFQPHPSPAVKNQRVVGR